MFRTLTGTELRHQTTRRVGGDMEDPVVARAYAYIPGGPTYWSREAFEDHVPPEDRWRFVILPEPKSSTAVPQSETTQKTAPVAPQNAPAAEARLAPGRYTVDDVVLLLTVNDPAGMKLDGVYDEYGNFLFPVPATEEELAAQWREFCEEEEGAGCAP